MAELVEALMEEQGITLEELIDQQVLGQGSGDESGDDLEFAVVQDPADLE